MELITNIKPKKNWDFKGLIQFILTEYYNHDDVTLYMTYNNKVCDHFSTPDLKIDALLDKAPVDHAYNLVVREYADLKTIIPHELIHLHQYEIGDLKLNKFEDKLIFSYKGEEYDPSTPYENRPWEQEAHDLDDKLWRKYKKHVKSLD